MKFIPNKKVTLYTAFILILAVIIFLFTFLIYCLSNNHSQKTSSSMVNGIPVPILMYHGLIKDTNLQNKFYISPETFSKDLDYLKSEGYTTIFMSDLIDYVNGINSADSLPQKPVIITFDDGYYNNYFYAYPLLKEKNMKATISIIGSMTEKFSLVDENNPAYSHVTWSQINEMLESGIIEIQNHTNDMHTYDNGRKGAAQNQGESLEAYIQVIENDVGKLQERIFEMTGTKPTTFTYPFGYMSKNSDEILKRLGFSATLGCEEGLNYITKDPECLFKMKRILRPLSGSLSHIL